VTNTRARNLKKVVGNHFTAKPQRAQRTHGKIKLHAIDEVIDQLNFDSNLCFAPLRLSGGS
jgi:hypothetical protein